MKTAALVFVVLVLVPAVALAGADPRKVPNATTDVMRSRADCSRAGYDCFVDPTGGEIPDNDPDGVLLGPISTPAGFTITDVVLNVDIDHTWIGDLIIRLYYDASCIGRGDVEGCVLCRHSYDACLPDGCCGCSGQLHGLYAFDDAAPSIENDCAANFEPGCYGPDYDSVGLDVFDGFATGGCFGLRVCDGAGGDVGTVHEWSVCLLGEADVPAGGGFDFLPGACPNPFNVRSKGKLPAAILGTDTFDASLVDVSSIRLEGVVEPVWSGLDDVGTPVEEGSEPCACSGAGPDGYTDLKLKFERQDIVDALGSLEDGDEVELTVTGSLLDGTPFTLSDCVQIIARGQDMSSTPDEGNGRAASETEDSTTWGAIKAQYR